ncbi:hypothetical protein [Thermopirellula anaerolimosa]
MIKPLSRRMRRPSAERTLPEPGVSRGRLARLKASVEAMIVAGVLLGGAAWLVASSRAAAMEPADAIERSEGTVLPAEAPSERTGDSLAQVLQWMSECEKRLQRGDTGPTTRQYQENVVKRLEELIRQSESESASSSASAAASQNSPSPSQESEDATANEKGPEGTQPGEGRASGGNGGRSDSANDLQMVLQRIWGELPQRQRDLLLQQGTESFLPKYRPMIEAYFRRLSEGRSARGNDGTGRLPRAATTIPNAEERK